MAKRKSQQISMERFKNRCFVGLNKVTLYTEGGEVLTGDNWLELTDEQSRRNMMLAFFAPRDLNGDPMDPATVLFEDGEEDADIELLQQMKNISLFDFCRAREAAPNTVHIVLVADVIFHWDSQDNYIQPTSDETWVDDLQAIIKGYPRTTEKHIYTDWEIPEKTDLADAKTHPLTDMPLDHDMWFNQPTFQEQYGTTVLLAGVALAVLAYFGLNYQETQISEINQRTQALNQQSSQYPNYRTLLQKVSSIEAYNRYQGLFSFAFKDIALAVADVEMELEGYTLQNPNIREAPEFFVARLTAPTATYTTFDQQEPLAENLLRASLAMTKMRKPATPAGAQTFTLEGLVPLQELARKHQASRQETDRMRGRQETQENNEEAG